MVDLTPEPGPLVVSKAPTPGVSPAQVAQPYAEFAHALDQSGEALTTTATNLAEQQGYKAVTRDAQGNVQIEKLPLIGPASVAYSRAVKFAALADGEAALKQADIGLRKQYTNDPQGYLAAADAFKQKTVEQYTQAGGADLGITLGKTIDATTTQTYRGLENESRRLALVTADRKIVDGIQSAKDDVLAMARGGDTSSPAFLAGMDKIHTAMQERVNNPGLAYPPEAAQYDRDQLDGELKGSVFLHDVNQTYENAPSKAQGAQDALKQAQSILSDPSLKLTPEQRNQFYSKAVGEIHANEAIRRQDISEARASEQSLRMFSATGGRLAPEDVEGVAQAYRAAGAPGNAARLYAWAARAPLGDSFGRQPIADMTRQLGAGGTLATSPAEAQLIQHESRGNPTLVNKLGYAGTYQFGAPLLKDIGVYTPGAGENVNDTNAPGQWSGQKWSGTFNVPGFPEVKTLRDFLANPAAQKAAFDLHSANMDSQISATGMDRFIGTNVGGVPITREGLHAMIHLGGAAGTMQTLASNGAVNPRDANGTSLLDYARMGSNAAALPNPASQMWLQANHATVLQKAARENWSTIVSDYTKDGIRPADDVINQITNAARATNDHALLDGIGQFVDRMDLAQRQSQQPLAQQESDIARLNQAGSAGQLSAGQAGVLKDLQTRYAAITKGLTDNPIATTVQNFPTRFNVPPPITPQILQDPAQLAAALGQRAQIAQFAQQNWGGSARQALDKADLDQLQGVLGSTTVNPEAKAGIFKAIATLPEDVRNATLAKLGKEGGPSGAVSAAAGTLMSSAPAIATSIIRGQDALKTDKTYWPKGPTEEANTNDAITKDLPASAFPLVGRAASYETTLGMVRARYADLSMSSGDASGHLNSDRLTTSINDVTGGTVSMNGSTVIAPQRGMAQGDFDRTIATLNDNDLAGITAPDGAPVTSDYLKGSATLESYGQGRYLVRLNDPKSSVPVYAYQGAFTESPQKFVLDLRNRQPGPITIGSAELAPQAGSMP